MPRFFKKRTRFPRFKSYNLIEKKTGIKIITLIEKAKKANKKRGYRITIMKEVRKALKFLGVDQTKENILRYSNLVVILPTHIFDNLLSGKVRGAHMIVSGNGTKRQYVLFPVEQFENKKSFRLGLRHELLHHVLQPNEITKGNLNEVATYAYEGLEQMLFPNRKKEIVFRLKDLSYSYYANIGIKAAKIAADLYRIYGRNASRKFLERIKENPPKSIIGLNKLKRQVIEET